MKMFAMDLAREFGHVCWRTFYASVSAPTIIDWEEYFVEHGFTHHNEDKRHGIICASIVNAIYDANGKRLQDPVSPLHFYPNTKIDTHENTDDELMAAGLAAGGTRFECSNC
jgi:hypothetical protein